MDEHSKHNFRPHQLLMRINKYMQPEKYVAVLVPQFCHYCEIYEE